ncbi:hypothetical protein OG239_36255 [Streptomyces sp. NBC_00868]|uniref:hypothetical protein n=1 Tax=Streptomyces sp. NBC_00868 TaxID=2903683 RepID=UPI0038636B30|nr:hypothetical protein OG239_36255 [Streptomyces sp. NBC_00868]
MKRATRGITLAVLAVVLAGCGGDPVGRANGDSLEGHESATSLTLSAEQVRVAIPSGGSLPEGWIGGNWASKPQVDEGAKAAKECGPDTQTSCAGLTAYGHRSVETKENAESTGKGAPVWFHIYSFDTAENAGVAFKGLVANKRKQASQGGSPPAPLTISAGADETDAFSEDVSGEYSVQVMMRVGGVVVYLKGYDQRKPDDLQGLAKLQIDRIRKTAEGKNPDA